MKRLLLLFTLVSTFVIASPVYADIARPSRSPEQPKIVLNTSLTVVPDSKSNDARLQISQESLKELREALGSSSLGSTSQGMPQSSTRTMMAGLLMFLSLSFGGIWLARSTQQRKNIVAALLIGVGIVSASAIVSMGNAGPPPAFVWRRLSQNLTQGRTTYGTVNIEIVSEGSGVTLIVPAAASR